MNLNLPIRFQEKINNKNEIKGCLFNLLSEFEQWLGDNSLEFFPEYTDHGVEHIQSVINAADELITENSWEVITPEDVYVLVVSILLHDCAMHISKAGFWSLLTQEQFNGVLLGFGIEEPWIVKWESYRKVVNKYSESDWLSLFHDVQSVELPEVGSLNLDDNQKILIGDFIRKYHANIAQVISVYGIPVKDGIYQIFDNTLRHLNELAGFIARSHNHSLRGMVDLIGLNERGRNYRNTHPCYMMGVLRLADYLQFSADRTPKILFKTKGICSPRSIHEWKKHFSILSTNKTQPDMELLFVNAYPDDAETLVGVKALLKGFQSELDDFWAVSGEVYSRYDDLKQLGVIYRRIKSNIDNANEYVSNNHKSYHPELLRISSDEQKIFPLLVGPLYGKQPQIGLRELIQNSIDACNERFSNESTDDATKSDIPYNVEIIINFDDNTISIMDEGIGMDIDIIKNYFLRIGASFRYSQAWKDMHIAAGISKVPRTGRFGIGMLAGFLLGDEISIFTRREGEPENKGVRFRYRLNSENIELRYHSKKKIGTHIVICSDQKILEGLTEGLKKHGYNLNGFENEPEYGFWYFLDTPKVHLKVIKNKKEETKENPYIINKKTLFDEWRHVKEITDVELFWRLNFRHINTYCNGILIKNLSTPNIEIKAAGYRFFIRDLEIMIIDRANNFPLNLTRNALVTDGYYRQNDISTDVLRFLMNKMQEKLKMTSYSHESIIGLFALKIFSYCDLLPFVFYKDKVIPIGSPRLTHNDNIIIVDFTFKNQKRGLVYGDSFQFFQDFGYLPVLDVEKKADSICRAILEYLVSPADKNALNKRYIDNCEGKLVYQTWLYIRKSDFRKLTEYDENAIGIENYLKTEINEDWLLFRNHEEINDDVNDIGAKIISSGTNSFMFAICKIINNSDEEFTKLWLSKGLPDEIVMDS